MLEEHLKGNSIIHKLDPRIKLIYAFIFSLVIALQNDLGSVITGLAIGIGLVLLARIEIKEVLKRLLGVDWFILLLWLIIPLTYPGDTFFRISCFKITYQGILFTILLTIKANAIMLILVCFLATSSIFDIVHSMLHLRIPEKLVFLFFLMFRYIWVLSDEYEKMVKALKARGFKLGNSIHTYRTIGYIVGGLLVKSYNRAENLYRAMVCRGFNGKFWLLDHFKFSIIDIVGISLLTTLNLAIIIIKWKKIL
jgi:cobalt/nickel transport system permease protein